MNRVDEAERALRICARDDRPRLDLFTAREDDAGGAAAGDCDLGDVSRRSDLDAGRARRRRQRVDERRGAAFRKPAGRDRVCFGRAEQQQHGGASRRPWPEKRSEDAAGGDGGAQRFALEPLAGEIGDGHRHPAKQTVRIGPAQRAESAAGLERLEQIGARRFVDRRRRRRRQCPQHPAYAGEAREELRILVRVFGRERADALSGSRGIAPQHQRRPAVDVRRTRAHIGSHDLEAVTRKIERADDAGIDRRGMRQPRAAPDSIRSLEDERLQPRLREERRRDEAVVTGADHDGVVGTAHHGRLTKRGLFVCFESSRFSWLTTGAPGCGGQHCAPARP